MTDLKPEDLAKLREIAEKAQAACPNWHHIGMSDPFAIYVNAFRPELVLSLLADRARMEKALERIERWFGEFPETGDTWEDGSPVSYATLYGSNGERDYMREIARQALGASQ